MKNAVGETQFTLVLGNILDPMKFDFASQMIDIAIYIAAIITIVISVVGVIARSKGMLCFSAKTS